MDTWLSLQDRDGWLSLPLVDSPIAHRVSNARGLTLRQSIAIDANGPTGSFFCCHLIGKYLNLK